MTDYKDHYYEGIDGAKLYARIYDHSGNQQTILCMHGLTRNSADFEGVASHVAKKFRVIAVDQRGRGKSAWDPNIENYNPAFYVQDMWKLLDGLGIDAVGLIGTSMGGLMSMMMGAMNRARVLGIVLNDIGPVIEEAGLARIKDYVGKVAAYDSWEDLAKGIANTQAVAFPNATADDWMTFAKRTGVKKDDGKIYLNYDPAIAVPVKAQDGKAIPPDLWPLFDMIKGIELLTIRGGISDILSAAVLEEMGRRHGDMAVHIVPNEGHAPFMEDPNSLKAIDTWASRVFRKVE